MTPWTYLVHLCTRRHTPLIAPTHQLVDLGRSTHRPLGEVLNEYAPLAVLSDVQLRMIGTEEVADGFVVDLEIRCPHHERSLWITLGLDVREYCMQGAWNDADIGWARIERKPVHRVGLTRTGLSVRDDRGVVPL
jgi:hypothetical protein